MADAQANQRPAVARADLGGLIAILVAMVLGVLVGLFYGRQMWLAGGGPAAQVKTL
jgi:solute carrier family 1 (neuronal/epithelial high affinity glutamate transporter), member 1